MPSSRSELAVSLLNQLLFFLTPYLRAKPPSDQTFSITCHSAQLLACFHTHIHTRCVCSGRFSQSAASSITRGRCYSHNSLASSALTRRPVLPPSIMSGKLQFPHVSYRELWSALIEYSWYFPRYCYWGLESRLLLQHANLQGRGKAIKKEEEKGTHPAVRSHIFHSDVLIIKSKHVPLFAIFTLLSPNQIMNSNKKAVRLSKPSTHPKKNYICPRTVRLAVNSNQWPIVAGLWIHAVPFCFRLTARSLHIQTTIIFTPFSLYLEVNGCQETNEAARNSCTSTGRLPCDAEGGIKQQTSPLLARGGEEKKKSFCFDEHVHTHTHQWTCCHSHNTQSETRFHFLPVSLRQLVSHVSH